MKESVKVVSDIQRQQAHRYIDEIPLDVLHVVKIEPYEEKRNLDQNAKMWPMLQDISKQVNWHGRILSTDDWKNVLTASLRGYDSVPNIDGTGFVVLGMPTSKMLKRVFCDLIELIYCFGAHHNVEWSEKSLTRFDEIRSK